MRVMVGNRGTDGVTGGQGFGTLREGVESLTQAGRLHSKGRHSMLCSALLEADDEDEDSKECLSDAPQRLKKKAVLCRVEESSAIISHGR